ncbi:MAG: DUF2059 domain-containing protein [bacterium]|jgi:hypothetical protein
MVHRAFFQSLVLGFFLFSVQNISAEDSKEARTQAAERYLAVVPISQLLDDTFREMSKSLPEAIREGFVAQMRIVVRADVLEAATRASLVRHFTVDELNAMAEFYSSPHGASAMRKFGAYMADVMPAVQEEMILGLDHMERQVE